MRCNKKPGTRGGQCRVQIDLDGGGAVRSTMRGSSHTSRDKLSPATSALSNTLAGFTPRTGLRPLEVGVQLCPHGTQSSRPLNRPGWLKREARGLSRDSIALPERARINPSSYFLLWRG
jgi:hypothetical protein